ncbi:MAG: HIT family protein [Actinomycetota bacterium]
MSPTSECLFCQIVAGELAAVIVHEDEQTIAFLDHRPLFEGHALLIPRHHFETLADLPSELVPPLFGTAQILSTAVQTAMDAVGTFVALNNKVSQSVPHLHVHIVPRRPKDGLRGFFWPRHKYESPERMAAVGAAIAAAAEGGLGA